MTGPSDTISVCICTFERPSLLHDLLASVREQQLSPEFSYEVVVVDNSKRGSALDVVRDFQESSDLPVIYDCVAEQNISLARNRAVMCARGNLVAFIDDDERPVREWLANLHRTLRQSGADGVLGPVLPDVPQNAPRWLTRGGFLERPRHATGTPITSKDARTGNVLLLRSTFSEEGFWFDPRFGKTGGEDSDFFRRQFGAGRTYVWCDEAAVYEVVPPERWTASYHVKRRLTSGAITGRQVRDSRRPAGTLIAKNTFTFFLGLLIAPLALCAPRHLQVRVFQKLAYCSGLVAAYFGWYAAEQR